MTPTVHLREITPANRTELEALSATELLSSCGRGEAPRYGFYLRQGLRDIGETHAGETVLTLPL